MSEGDPLDVLTLAALAHLQEASSRTLYAFASGLRMTEGAVSRFGLPILYLADDVCAGRPISALTRIAFNVALKDVLIRDPSLVARLAAADSPFWKATGDALAWLAEEELAA